MTVAKIKEDQIRDAAYLLWLEEGQPHGRDQEHWHKAIDALNVPTPKAKSTRKAPAKPRAAKAKAAAKPEAESMTENRKPRASKAALKN